MKNITISIDDDLAQYAKSLASSQSKSLSRFVADMIYSLKETEEARQSSLSSYKSRRTLFSSSKSRTWKREDLYDRKVLR